MSETEVKLRNFNSESDYAVVKHLLEEAQMFDPAWDDEERLKQKSLQKPDTLIVTVLTNSVILQKG